MRRLEPWQWAVMIPMFLLGLFVLGPALRPQRVVVEVRYVCVTTTTTEVTEG